MTARGTRADDDPRRRCLPGADLRGADLHDVDLRGLDLEGADLRGADLRGARTGLGSAAIAVHVVAATVVAGLGGLTSAWLGEKVFRALQSPNEPEQIAGVLLASEFAICLAAMVVRGTRFTFQYVVPSTGVLLVVASAGLAVLRGRLHGSGILLPSLLVLFIVMFTAVVVARASAAALHKLALLPIAGAWCVGALGAHGRVAAFLVANATAIAGWRAVTGSATSPRLSRLVRILATIGGTSLRNADLRSATLAGARLRSSDLRGARIDRDALRAAREVRFCRFDDEPRGAT